MSFNLSGRIAALLAAAAVIVVLLVGWFLLISPQRGKAAELGTKIDQTQVEIASTQAYVNSPVTRRAIHDVKRLQKVLPDDPKMSQILRQLSEAARAAQVRVDTITPSAVVPSTGGEAVPISLAVSGHYFNISKFLHILRTQVDVRGSVVRGSGRLYSIDGIQFSAGSGSIGGSSSVASTETSGSSGTGTITASITLNAFVFATPPSALTAPGGTTTPDATASTDSSTAVAPASP